MTNWIELTGFNDEEQYFRADTISCILTHIFDSGEEGSQISVNSNMHVVKEDVQTILNILNLIPTKETR